VPKQLSQALIEQWIALVKGKFSVHDIWQEIGIDSAEGKTHLRVILSRLEEKGIICGNGGGGIYRKVDTEAPIIQWQNADPEKIVDLKFPFGIDEVCKIYPKSIIIIAGSKNAGKTAWMYNFIALNMDRHVIDLYNSETSPEQMKERFAPLDIPEPAPFNVYERYDNFADIIKPDRVSVIDYLDMNSEVYLVGAEIDAIFRKLTSGVAVIGLQKPPPTVAYPKGVKKVFDRDLAYGGGFTAKRAVLYISMSNSRLKLVYVKTPRQRNIRPDNMTWTYRISDDGTHFTDIQRYYGDGE